MRPLIFSGRASSSLTHVLRRRRGRAFTGVTTHEAEAARRTRADAGAGAELPRHAMPHVFEVRPPHRKNPLIERSSSSYFQNSFRKRNVF